MGLSSRGSTPIAQQVERSSFSATYSPRTFEALLGWQAPFVRSYVAVATAPPDAAAASYPAVATPSTAPTSSAKAASEGVAIPSPPEVAPALLIGYAVLDRPRRRPQPPSREGGEGGAGGGGAPSRRLRMGRLVSLAVAPGGRGRGIGAALLSRALADAAALDGLKAVALCVRVDNAAAQVRPLPWGRAAPPVLCSIAATHLPAEPL